MSIDYGHGTTANRNPETGIRYSIVPARLLPDWIWDHVESEYAFGCGFCGVDWDRDNQPEFPHTCECGETTDDESEAYSDEAIGHTISLDGVEGRLDESGDLWIFSSPATAHGSHCSPCAPGAVYLDGSGGDVLAYGMPNDWKESEAS